MSKMTFPNALLDETSNKISANLIRDFEAFVRTRKPSMPLGYHVEVDVIVDASLDVNAYARLGTRDTIALNFGLLLWTFQIVSNFICESAKDITHEICQHDMSTSKYSECRDEKEAIRVFNLHRSDIGEEHQDAYIVISSTLLLVLLCHETVHIVRGHLLVLSTLSRRPNLTLWDSYSEPASDDTKLMRAIEFDADRYAAFLAADIAILHSKSFTTLGKNKLDYLLTAIIFCNSLICGYRHTRYKADERDWAGYPSPLARMTLFVAGIMEALEGRLTPSRVTKAVRNGTLICRGMHNVFLELKMMEDLGKSETANQLEDEISIIQSEMTEHRKYLERVGYLILLGSRGGRFAPPISQE